MCNPNMVKKRELSNPISIVLIIAVAVFLLQSFFIFTGLIKINSNLLGNLFVVLISFLALISIFILYRKFPEYFPMEKKGKLFLLISLALFFLGDLTWTIEQVVLKNTLPIGGIPDLCWNLAYFSLGTSLIFFIKTGFRKSNLGYIITTSLGSIAGLIYLYFDIVKDINLGSFSFIHLIQDLYFFYDFIILAFGIILVYPLIISKSKLFLGWIILGLGILARMIYDISFANMSENGTYYTGHPIDLIYVLFYLAIIINGLVKFNLLNKK